MNTLFEVCAHSGLVINLRHIGCGRPRDMTNLESIRARAIEDESTGQELVDISLPRSEQSTIATRLAANGAFAQAADGQLCLIAMNGWIGLCA